MTKVLQIKPNSSCENHCAFCSASGEKKTPDMTLVELRVNLDFFIETRGVTEVVLSGGELTGREDFPELLAMIASKHLDLVTVISSGLGWTPELLELSAGIIDRFVLSVTPWSARDLEDPSSQMVAQLRFAESLLEMSFLVQTNTVVIKDNLSVLRRSMERIGELGLQAPSLTFPFPVGRAKRSVAEIIPAWEVARRPIFEALEAVSKLEPKLVNLPLCYVGDYRRYCRPTTTRILVEKGRQLEDHAIIPPFVGKGHLLCCEECRGKPDCDGFWPFYLELEGMFPPLRAI